MLKADGAIDDNDCSGQYGTIAFTRQTQISMTEKTEFNSWPVFASDEIEAATAVLKSGRVNYWTGEQGKLFEQELASSIGTQRALVLANGTVALELALKAAGIGEGDTVIVTPRSYFASVGAVIAVGARPVFADIDRQSQNMCPQSVEERIDDNTAAIIPVHIGGWPCDMEAIGNLAMAHNVVVIEDCAQALGATLNNKMVGSFGSCAAFSFCQEKIVTRGGEGGALVTDNEELFSAAWSLREDGKNSDLLDRSSAVSGFPFIRDSIGSNARMTEVQSAIGRRQLGKLAKWLQVRREYAEIYHEEFSDAGAARVEVPPEHVGHAYYQYCFYLRPDALKSSWSRDRVVSELRHQGVSCSSGACGEIFREPIIQSLGLGPESPMPVARELAQTSIVLPVHPALTPEQVGRIASLTKSILGTAKK